MRVVKLTLLAAVLALVAAAAPSKDFVAQFELFKKTHKREYVSRSEEAKRLGYFVRNMQRAAELQALNPHARFGANEFADLSEAEFQPLHNAAGHFRSAVAARQHNLAAADDAKAGSQFPQNVDWRTKGVVTPIKNQGLKCGACWSFSTTGNIEGQWAIAGNTLVSLSEQELVSCDTTCNGCHGGLMDLAFDWLVATQGGGITSEAQYPYVSGPTGIVPACDLSGKSSVAWITGHVDLAHNERVMAEWLAANGPVSIGVDATSFQSYQGGIMTNCQAVQVDHAVLAVGYDLTNSPPYWIIKNQWGTSWGEDGYIRLQYGQNLCLITTAPSSSVVNGSNPQPPSPPSPPSPPTPPTPPSSGSFTQYVCPGAFCLSDCTKNTFQTGVCLSLGSGSAIAACGTNNLNLQVFNSSDCSGSSTEQQQPLDTCEQDTSGSYIYTTCSASSTAVRSNANVTLARRR